MASLYDYEELKVLVPGPSPFPLARVGGCGDGAYLVPDDLDGVTDCFSPGVDNRKVFEDELAERYSIKSHMCDFTSDEAEFKSPLIRGMQTFRKQWLAAETKDDSISLQDWVVECAADGGDLLLQMDIEGAEYDVLANVSETVLRRFRIIVLELHQLDHLVRGVDSKRAVINRALHRLSEVFSCVHVHPNNCCGDTKLPDGRNLPRVLEVTLLRRDRFNNLDASAWFPPSSPHPLDIAKNVKQKPALFLNEAWGGFVATPEAKRIRAEVRLEEQLAYTRNLEVALKWVKEAFCRFHERYIDVEGHRTPGNRGEIEIAAGKSFVVSTPYPGTPGRGQIGMVRPFAFHTAFAPFQFVTIDLGQIYSIGRIVLMNRTDCCQERALHLFWCIHLEEELDWSHGLPVPCSEGFVDGSSSSQEFFTGGRVGRYVSLMNYVESAIHLSNVEVYGALMK